MSSGTVSGAEAFEAVQWIDTDQDFTVETTGCVSFFADTHISLDTGFRVELGGTFEAVIE